MSLTAPYTNRKKLREKVVIDTSYVRALKDDPENAAKKMDLLSVAQLRKVAQELGLPVSSKSAKSEIKQVVTDFLLSESRWKGIARPQQ